MTEYPVVQKLLRVFKTAVRFGLGGLATIGVYFLVLALLQPVLPNVVYLSAAAYVTSAVFNYMFQSQVTFGTGFADRRAVARYLWMHACLMGLNSTLMFVLVTKIGMELFLSQLIVTLVVAGTSFGVSYLWVYRKTDVDVS